MKKKYVYTYDRICEHCKQPFQTQRYTTKLCSKECISAVLAQKKRKYTQEQIDKAIEMKLAGYSSTEIEKESGIKKPTQDQLFKEKNIRLNEEQHKALLQVRWKDYEPIVDGKKQCSRCKLWKPVGEFQKNKNRLSGKVSECKNCAHLFYEANQDAIKQRVHDYRINNPEKSHESYEKYYEKNSDKYITRAKKWASENPEKRKAITARYSETHPGAKAARCAKYRAQKQRAMPPWLTPEQLQAIKNIYKNRPAGYHVDHIVPLNGEEVSGLHVPWNLQYLPEGINESKGNRFFDENGMPKVECYQHQRKLDTLEEDLKNGMIIETDLNKFILAQEQFGEEHKRFIERYEWLGTTGYSPKWAFTARVEGKLGGVVLMSEPNAYTGDKAVEALISRGATASWTPKNLGSKLIMFACREMVKNTSKRVFFGYSDHEAGEIGTIYQACNFQYLGDHFGAKLNYIMPSGKVVTARYFTKTSTYKKYAQQLGIQWQPNWSKPNKYMNLKEIPKEVLALFKELSIKERAECEKQSIEPKSKYVMIIGKNRNETRILQKTYKEQHWGDSLPYPKRKE